MTAFLGRFPKSAAFHVKLTCVKRKEGFTTERYAEEEKRTRVSSMFREVGFVEEGRWIDFYERGIDEVHFRLNL